MFLNLETFSRVKEFIKISQDISSEVILKSDRFTVDGKSILGVLSLDLCKPVELVCDEHYLDMFKKFTR